MTSSLLSVDTDILPETNNVYDIGEAANTFKDIYSTTITVTSSTYTNATADTAECSDFIMGDYSNDVSSLILRWYRNNTQQFFFFRNNDDDDDGSTRGGDTTTRRLKKR